MNSAIALLCAIEPTSIKDASSAALEHSEPVADRPTPREGPEPRDA